MKTRDKIKLKTGCIVAVVCLITAFDLPAQTKTDIQRIEKMQPIVSFYDSLVRNGEWFYMTLYYDQLQCVFMYNNTECNCSDSLFVLAGSALHYSEIVKLYEMMKVRNYIEIGGINWPDESAFEIGIVYEKDLRGRKHRYIFPKGIQASENALRNSFLKNIGNNVYKEVYKDH